MGVLPNTGQTISMGRARNAYGLSGTVNLSTANGPLGIGGLGSSANIHLSGSGTVTLQPFPFSSRLGGRNTPNTY